MKNLIFILFIPLLFTNCTHRIVRKGYAIKKSDYKTCNVVIKKGVTISESVATNVGEIKLGETGLSVACSEAHALEILKREACAINADIVVITEEYRPDAWSSCYRCYAKFYLSLSLLSLLLFGTNLFAQQIIKCNPTKSFWIQKKDQEN